MAEYVDHEARDIAALVLDELIEFGIEGLADARKHATDLLADVISGELDTIREERFDSGHTAGWMEGDDHGYTSATEEVAKQRRERGRSPIVTAWQHRLREAGWDCTVAPPPPDPDSWAADWLAAGTISVTMSEHEARRLIAS